MAEVINTGPEEVISQWSGKIQAACKALNRVVLEHTSQEN